MRKYVDVTEDGGSVCRSSHDSPSLEPGGMLYQLYIKECL